MKVIITLGPTQEPIDDVRYITNASSGRMGAALAEEGLRRGHKVTIVSGPVSIRLPKKAAVYRVRTAAEMTDRTISLLKGHDILVSTAAIADYTPAKKASGKIKSGGSLRIRLKRTRKLIKEARRRHPRMFIVGFKAEHGIGRKRLVESAKKLLAESKLDLVVANDLKGGIFGSAATQAYMIDGKSIKPTGRVSKRQAARKIWSAIMEGLTASGLTAP